MGGACMTADCYSKSILTRATPHPCTLTADRFVENLFLSVLAIPRVASVPPQSRPTDRSAGDPNRGTAKCLTGADPLPEASPVGFWYA